MMPTPPEETHPGRFIKDAAKDLKGANPSEAIRIVTKVFDRHNRKDQS
jgi:hypothetical protein